MKRIALFALLAVAAAARAGVPSVPAPARTSVPAPVATPGALRNVPEPPASRPPAAGVRGSHHDLSKDGPGPVKAVSESDPCIFCHVSHHGTGTGNNRPDSNERVQRYRSSTMSASARMDPSPTGATRICLSCHDGTIALGKTLTRDIRMTGTPDGKMPAGAGNLGTDLRGTHPVSLRPSDGPRVHHPPRGDAVKLDMQGELQCTACHDPHKEYVDADHGNFLVKTTRDSELCLTCHDASAFQPAGAAHAAAQVAASAQQLATDNRSDRTVAAAGCLACHPSHFADKRGRLLKQESGDDQQCLGCHDGTVAIDVASAVRKLSAHAAPANALTVHDAGEGPSGPVRLPETSQAAPRHVTCADCHDPHAAGAATGPSGAPYVQAALAGVWGIDRNGSRVDPARYEYEVCFKCHGDSQNQPQATAPPIPGEPRRAVADVDLRRVFGPSAASAHPVVSAATAADVPSLVATLTPRSQIYCTDCHGTDAQATAAATAATIAAPVATLATRRGLLPAIRSLAPLPARAPAAAPGPTSATAARGPHGSSIEHLLSLPYATADGTPEGPSAYALCYKCHDRSVLLSDASAFPLHGTHVAGDAAPCSACHDPHGVSSLQGNPVNNAHLVNFDVSIVRPNSLGLLSYASRGRRAGTCSLSCHGKDHVEVAYPAVQPAVAIPASRLRVRAPIVAPRVLPPR